MLWLWIALSVMLLLALGLFLFHRKLFATFIPYVVRVFQEKPLFIAPFGQPNPAAEDVSFPTSHGLTLKGCYFKARGPRRGVLLFGIEFGSNRWSCCHYSEYLIDNGYDVFSFEMRGQGESPAQPGYEPLQWVTDFDVEDFRAAVRYLKSRPDADPRGIGFFGLSKGAGAGILAAVEDPWIRCCVTDGMFAAFTVMVPYMMKWVYIYSKRPWLVKFFPRWYFGYAASVGLRQIERLRNCHFSSLEKALPRLSPRPLFMIHGEADNYIKPEMAQALFAYAHEPKSFWLVEKAKHNQALPTAREEYQRRVLEFFRASMPAAPELTPQPQSTPDAGRPDRVALSS